MKRPLVIPGIVLGMGFGGFADGIVLHQILGWHHLICSTDTCRPTSVEDLQAKNRADGLFHLGVWVLSLIGTRLLWRALQLRETVRSGRVLIGAMLAGWGIFNVVEGVIDHQILGIHHVRPFDPNWLAWDIGFLLFGVLLILAGWGMIRGAGEPAGTYAGAVRGA